MTLKDFFVANNIEGKPQIKVAESCYEGSDEPIRYIKLNKPVEGFNFITISKNGYEHAKEDKANLKGLEMAYDEDYGWKAQMPDSRPTDDLSFDW